MQNPLSSTSWRPGCLGHDDCVSRQGSPPSPRDHGDSQTGSTHLRFSKNLLGQEAQASGGDQSLAVTLRGPRASATGSLRPRPSNKDLGLGVHLQGGSGRNHSGVGKWAGADKGCVGYQALGCLVNRSELPRGRGSRVHGLHGASLLSIAGLPHCWGGAWGGLNGASECGGGMSTAGGVPSIYKTFIPCFSLSAWSPGMERIQMEGSVRLKTTVWKRGALVSW